MFDLTPKEWVLLILRLVLGIFRKGNTKKNSSEVGNTDLPEVVDEEP